MSSDAEESSGPDYEVFWTHTLSCDLDLGDLRNEVHPIFAKHNFPGADEDYASYLPSLRLASLLLVCCSKAPFLPFGREVSDLETMRTELQASFYSFYSWANIYPYT